MVGSLLEKLSKANKLLSVRDDKLGKVQAHLSSLENDLKCPQERLSWVNPSDEVIPSNDDHRVSFVNQPGTVKEVNSSWRFGSEDSFLE
jgi:hypothetical protein